MIDKITVVGSTPFSIALAGEFAGNGYSVSLWENNATPSLKRLMECNKINITGTVEKSVQLEYIGTAHDVISNAELIILCTQPSDCENTIKQIIPYLKSNQHLIVFPGNFCAVIIKKILHEYGINDIVLSEAVSMPFVFDMADFNTVRIHKYKEKLKIASCPAGRNAEVISILNKHNKLYVPAANIIETSLENINSILHPLPMLLNIAELERKGKEFHHFTDGISPCISVLLEKMDSERIAIGRAFGLNLVPTLEQLKDYYGKNKSQTIYEYIQSPECPYEDIKGFALSSRYITVDVPYLLVPASSLAEAAAVKTPIFNLCITLASLINNTDYFKSGYNLKILDFEKRTKEEILQNVSSFCN